MASEQQGNKDVGRNTQDPATRTGKDSDKGRRRRPEPPRTAMLWLLIIVTFVLGLRFMQSLSAQKPTEITYSQFESLLQEHGERIKAVRVTQRGLRATLRGELSEEGPLAALPDVKHTAGSHFFVVDLPVVDPAIYRDWQGRGFAYTFESERYNFWDILGFAAPWLILIFFWLFMMRQMQAGQRGIFSFGKSKAKLHSLDRPQNTFADVAGSKRPRLNCRR